MIYRKRVHEECNAIARDRVPTPPLRNLWGHDGRLKIKGSTKKQKYKCTRWGLGPMMGGTTKENATKYQINLPPVTTPTLTSPM